MIPIAINDKHLMMEHAYQAGHVAASSSSFSYTYLLWGLAFVTFLILGKISIDGLRCKKHDALSELLEYQV